MLGRRRDAHAIVGRPRCEHGAIDRLGQLEHEVQARVRPSRLDVGEQVGEGFEQRRAPPRVLRARSAKVAVEGGRLEHASERELLERRRSAVELAAPLDRLARERRGHEQPPEAQARGERLRDRPRQQHAVLGLALQPGRRRAAVAVVGAAVVLEHGQPRREQRVTPRT